MAGRKGAPDCPICLESLDPPKRIFQCSEGHFLCESCRRNPAIKWCPTCRGPIVGRNIGMEQVLQEFVGVSDNLPQNQRACISLPDSYFEPLSMSMSVGRGARRGMMNPSQRKSRRPVEMEGVRASEGRGMMTPSQRMARRSGEMVGVSGSARRSGEMVGLRAFNASEDESSSTTSYGDNDLNTNRLLSVSRGRGLRIIKGVKKPGGFDG